MHKPVSARAPPLHPAGGSATRNANDGTPLTNKTERIVIRTTAAEKAEAERRAEAAGSGSLSDYMRSRVLDDGKAKKAARAVVQVEAMDPVLFAELSAIGNNLNQIARALNRGRDPVPAHLADELAALFRVMMADEVTARRIRSAERARKAQARPE